MDELRRLRAAERKEQDKVNAELLEETASLEMLSRFEKQWPLEKELEDCSFSFDGVSNNID